MHTSLLKSTKCPHFCSVHKSPHDVVLNIGCTMPAFFFLEFFLGDAFFFCLSVLVVFAPFWVYSNSFLFVENASHRQICPLEDPISNGNFVTHIRKKPHLRSIRKWRLIHLFLPIEEIPWLRAPPLRLISSSTFFVLFGGGFFLAYLGGEK